MLVIPPDRPVFPARANTGDPDGPVEADYAENDGIDEYGYKTSPDTDVFQLGLAIDWLLGSILLLTLTWVAVHSRYLQSVFSDALHRFF